MEWSRSEQKDVERDILLARERTKRVAWISIASFLGFTVAVIGIYRLSIEGAQRIQAFRLSCLQSGGSYTEHHDDSDCLQQGLLVTHR